MARRRATSNESAWASLVYLLLVSGESGTSRETFAMPSETTMRWGTASLFLNFSCFSAFQASNRPAARGVKSLAPTPLSFSTTRSRFLVGCWMVKAFEPLKTMRPTLSLFL